VRLVDERYFVAINLVTISFELLLVPTKQDRR